MSRRPMMTASVRLFAFVAALVLSLGAATGRQETPSAPAPQGEPQPPAKPAPGLLPLELVAEIEPPARPVLPLLLQRDSLVVVSRQGAVEAFSVDTGEKRWERPSGPERPLPPVPWDDQILVAASEGSLLWLDGLTGAIEHEGRAPCPLGLAPLKDGDRLYLASPEGVIVAVESRGARELWRTAVGLEPRALARGGELLIVSGDTGMLIALRAADGEEVWRFRGRGAFDAAAVFGEKDERLFIGDRAGIFYALDVEDGKQRYAWSTGAAIEAPAVVEGDRVYAVSYANTLFAYRAGSGDELWRVPLPGRPASPAVRVDKRLVVATLEGSLVEIDPGRGAVDKATYQASKDILAPPSIRATHAALTLLSGRILLLRKQPAPVVEPAAAESASQDAAPPSEEPEEPPPEEPGEPPLPIVPP